MTLGGPSCPYKHCNLPHVDFPLFNPLVIWLEGNLAEPLIPIRSRQLKYVCVTSLFSISSINFCGTRLLPNCDLRSFPILLVTDRGGILLGTVGLGFPRRRAYNVYKKPNSYSLSNRRLSIATWQCVAMDLFTDKFIIEGSAVAVPCNVVEEGIIAHVSLTTIMVSLQENIDLDIAYIVDSLPQFCLYVL